MNPKSFEAVLLGAGMPAHVAEHYKDVLLPFELRPHQILGLQCGLYWNRFGLYHDVRTGKTIVMLLLAIFYARYKLKSTFLLPPILFDQIIDELNRIENHGVTYAHIEGSSKSKLKTMQNFAMDPSSAPDITITTSSMFAGPHGKNKSNNMKYWQYFARWSNNLLFDECHLGLQSEESSTFRAVEGFIKTGDKKRLVLSSGSPIMTELASAYPQIRLKTPEIYTSRTNFNNTHVREVSIEVKFFRGAKQFKTRVNKIDGYEAVDTLSANFYKNAHRVSKFEVLKFADPNVQAIPITLSPKHMKFYKQLVNERLVELSDDVLIDLRQDNEFLDFVQRIITSPEWGGEIIKDNAVVDAIKAIAGTANVKDGKKLIVFANYNSSVLYLKEKLAAYSPAVIFGGNNQSGEKNRAEIAKFKKTRECQIAIINPQAGGVGLTLGDVCQMAVYAEPVTSPGLFEQSAARILLNGQTEPSVVYVLSVTGTLSEKRVGRLLEKGEQIEQVVRDKKTLLSYLT